MLKAIKKYFVGETTQALTKVETITLDTEKKISRYTTPVRQSIIKRFPVMFALLVTTGVSATFLGIERLITNFSFLNDSPTTMLLLGITILAFTGRLYKKLG